MPTPTSALRGTLKKCQGPGWVCTVCPATRKGQPFFPNLVAALNHEQSTHDTKPPAAANGGAAGHVDTCNEVCVLASPLQPAGETCWDKIGSPPLTSEGLRQWEMHAHVDHVYDLVPFWQRGIDAAEKGEVLRLEEFLNEMEGDGGWRTADEVLGTLQGNHWKASQSEAAGIGWGEPYQDDWAVSQRGAWGIASPRLASDATKSSRGRNDSWGVGEDWARSDLKMGRLRVAAAAQPDGCDPGALVKPMRAMQGDSKREELRHFVDAIARQEAVNEDRRKRMHLFFEMSNEQKVQKIQETIRFLRTYA